MTQLLTPTFLVLLILVCLFGFFCNSYAANYMRNNFDLSKRIYRTLFWCCLINTIGFFASVIADFCLLIAPKHEFICILFEISLSRPFFIVQCLMLEVSILRCIIRRSKTSAEELIDFQRTVAFFMTSLTIAYVGTFSTFLWAKDEPLGFGYLVSIKSIIRAMFLGESPITYLCYLSGI